MNIYVVDSTGFVIAANRSGGVDIAAWAERMKSHYTQARASYPHFQLPLKIVRSKRFYSVGTTVDKDEEPCT